MHYENIFSQRIQIYLLFNIIDTIDIFYMIDQTQGNFNCIIFCWMHYGKQELCYVSKAHGEAQKTLGKPLPSVTLDKQHTTYTMTVKVFC